MLPTKGAAMTLDKWELALIAGIFLMEVIEVWLMYQTYKAQVPDGVR